MRLPGKITRYTLACLGGFCFFLSALEYMVPKPLPFIRLGLANLPLLLALDIMSFPSFMLLAALKIIGQALISGALFSYVFLFSLGGTGISAVIMYALRRGLGKEKISLAGISVAGALASNGVQLILAYFFIFGDSIRYAAAPILALGLVTGTLLGIAGEYFIRQSQWYRRMEDPAGAPHHVLPLITKDSTQWRKGTKGNPGFEKPDRISAPLRRREIKSKIGCFRITRNEFCMKTFSSGELALAGLCMIPALLIKSDAVTRIIQFLFFWALAWLSGKKNNPLITLSVIAGIVFFNLLVPYGEVLLSIGPLKITSGALRNGIIRAVTLEALFMLSRCCVRRDLAFPGTFGEIIGESFRFFARLGEDKNLITPKNWIRNLDELLIIYGEKSFPAENETAAENIEPGKAETCPPRLSGRTFCPRIILIVTVILAWLPLLITALPLR